jgi:multiple sugar transport system permease protein
VRTLAAVALTVFFLFPIYWLFMISFKTGRRDLRVPAAWWPAQIGFDTYAVLFKDGDATTVWNSFVVAGASTLLAMLLGTMCAYSLARFRTGGEHLSNWIVSQRMVPPIAWCSRSSCCTCSSAGSTPTSGSILLYTAFNLPYVIWMMRGYILDIPLSLEEAAMVDGCTRWQVFVKVVLPMSRAGLLRHRPSFTFVFAWNEFLFALVFTRTEVTTYTVQVTHYFGGQSNFWAKISAMSVLGTVPIFIVVAFMQRYLVRGISLGAGEGMTAGRPAHHRPAQVLRQRHAVRGVDLQIADREFTVLVGQSGCGKSTLCAPSPVSEDADEGSIAIGGRLVNDEPPAPARHRDGVPELRALPVHDGVREHRLRPAGAQDARPGGRRQGCARPRACWPSSTCSSAIRASSRAGSCSAWPSGAPSCATRACTSSTSRCPTWTRNCATRCAARSSACTRSSARPWST